MVVMSKRRFRIYGGWLLATVGLIVAACFAVNCLVDPLWYLRGNVLTGINYPFNFEPSVPPLGDAILLAERR